MKAFLPISTYSSPSFLKPSTPISPMIPHKSLRSQFTLSQALLPSRCRITKNRVVSHTIKLDFSNMRSCSELARLHLLYTEQHINNILSSLSKSATLHELSIVIISDTWHQKFQKTFYSLLHKLPRLKSISTLNLYFSSSRILDKKLIRELNMSLHHLKKLKACNIRVHWCSNITYQDIPQLLMPLRYQALKELTVSFYGASSHPLQKPKSAQIQHQPLNILRKFRQCHSVGLELDLNVAFTDSDLLALASGIKRLDGLQSFYLKVGAKDPINIANIADSITDHGLLTFMSRLNALPFLSKLLLHIMNCKRISEDGVRKCITSYFDPTRYSKLSYKLDGFVMSKSKKMLAFAEFLSHFEVSKDITLRVLSCPDFAISYNNNTGSFNQSEGQIRLCCDVPAGLNYEDYHEFARAFSQLSNLKAFNFTCRDNAYTWELTQQICTVKPLPMQLPALNINFLHLKIMTDEIMKASQATSLLNLLTTLTNIQGLSLRLPYCSSLPEETMIQIMGMLASLKGLKHLALSFIRCQRITDTVLLVLTKSIEQYKILENLSIQFEVNKTITNKSVLKLAEVIQKVESLKNLNLSFQDCVLLTVNCIQGLPDTLANLRELQGLSLVFPGIAEISNFELQRLGSSISKLNELSNIKLDFSNSEEISDGGLYALGKSVMQAGKVRYLEIYLDNCLRLGNEGICQVGKHFKSLKELFSLKMSLKGCRNITPEGVNQLIGEMCAVEKLEFLTLDFGSGDHSGEVFHRADVFLKFERMENISLNLRAGKDIFPQRVGELRKKLGEIRQVAIFFK